MQAEKPLRQIFQDINYAWELLQNEVKLETSDQINGQDVSYLLQLYMRGVEKMNSLIDIRQSFFKNKVTSLMSKPSVIKILNKPMNKKNKVQEASTCSPPRKIDSHKQLQLKQKRKQIEMRLAYGAEEHSTEALNKMVAEHNQKQSIIENRITKIMDTHEEKLAKRIRERKLRTMTAKSKSDIFLQEGQQINGWTKKQMLEKKRDEEQFGVIPIIEEKVPNHKSLGRKRKYKSLSPKKTVQKQQMQSPSKARRISLDFREIQNEKTD